MVKAAKLKASKVAKSKTTSSLPKNTSPVIVGNYSEWDRSTEHSSQSIVAQSILLPQLQQPRWLLSKNFAQEHMSSGAESNGVLARNIWATHPLHTVFVPRFKMISCVVQRECIDGNKHIDITIFNTIQNVRFGLLNFSRSQPITNSTIYYYWFSNLWSRLRKFHDEAQIASNNWSKKQKLMIVFDPILSKSKSLISSMML